MARLYIMRVIANKQQMKRPISTKSAPFLIDILLFGGFRDYMDGDLIIDESDYYPL